MTIRWGTITLYAIKVKHIRREATDARCMEPPRDNLTRTVLSSLALVTSWAVVLRMQIWGILYIEIAISKLSGSTVKVKPNYLPKPLDFWHISLQNCSNWPQIQVLNSIVFNLMPRLSNWMILQAWSFIKRFTAASTKFRKIGFEFWRKLDRN